MRPGAGVRAGVGASASRFGSHEALGAENPVTIRKTGQELSVQVEKGERRY